MPVQWSHRSHQLCSRGEDQVIKVCNLIKYERGMMDDHIDPHIHSHQSGVNQSHQTSHNDSECDVLPYSPHLVSILYFLMFPVALFLNVVAAWVLLHLKSTTTFVVYLKNLVAADILMTLMIPIIAAGNLPELWDQFFISACRFTYAIFYNIQYTCITLLGFISLDRFFKIMMPHSRFCQNLTFSKVISGSVWVIMFVGTGLPNIILTNISSVNVTHTHSCMTLKGSEGIESYEKTSFSLNVFFWVVCVVIVFCYICITKKVIQSYRNSGSNNSQGKQKIKLRVFLVIVVFFVSFGPYHLIRIPYTLLQVSQSSEPECSHTYMLTKFAKELSLWLATTNICMDPLLYIFLCREFKEKLMSMMKNVFNSVKVATLDKSPKI